MNCQIKKEGNVPDSQQANCRLSTKNNKEEVSQVGGYIVSKVAQYGHFYTWKKLAGRRTAIR